jgi:hypothetical protein
MGLSLGRPAPAFRPDRHSHRHANRNQYPHAYLHCVKDSDQHEHPVEYEHPVENPDVDEHPGRIEDSDMDKHPDLDEDAHEHADHPDSHVHRVGDANPVQHPDSFADAAGYASHHADRDDDVQPLRGDQPGRREHRASRRVCLFDDAGVFVFDVNLLGRDRDAG